MRVLEVSIAIVLGIASWWLWEPSVGSLRYGIVFYVALLICLRKSNYSRVVIWVLAFLVGSLRMASMPTAVDVDVDEDVHTVGWVVHRNHRVALIESETERWKINFYPVAPPQGALVGVWHQPSKNTLPWEGGVDDKRREQAERTGRRRAKDWVLLTEPKRLIKPTILEELNHGGILWALLSGDKSDIDSNTKTVMQETGTSHLLAISGMHIGLVSACTYGLIHWLLGWIVLVEKWQQYGLGRWIQRVALLGSMVVACVYGQQVGWPASAQRAVLMVCIFCLGKFVELSFSVWDVLGLAAVMMVWMEPSLLHDLGFQLSFSAVAGIAMFGKQAHQWTSKSQTQTVRAVILSVGLTIGATLGTLPICGWVFQSLPISGVLANLLATPFIATLAVPISMLGVFVDTIQWKGMSIFCFAFADACIEVGLWLLQWCRVEPLVVAFDVWDVWLALILVLCAGLSKAIWVNIVSFMALVGLVWCNTPYVEMPNSDLDTQELKVTFLPVGQGDATLLEWSDGTVWLVDGGPFNFELLPYLRRRGIWTIDAVWLSHPHADHMDGLFPVLEELDVKRMVVGRLLEAGDQGGRYSALWKLARDRGVPIQIAEQVQHDPEFLNKGLRILHPHDWTVDSSDRCNEESVVMEITHKDRRLLLMGDVEEDAERELEKVVRSADLLKVAHHGSKSSTSPDLIQLIDPKVSVISVGKQNRFGHPHAQTLWTLRHSQVLRTDIDGAVEVSFKSGTMAVQRTVSE